MKLGDLKKGRYATILSVPDKQVRAQTFRFGIAQGETIKCIENIRGGPVVVEKNFQEIAIGRKLTDQITVKPQTPQEDRQKTGIYTSRRHDEYRH